MRPIDFAKTISRLAMLLVVPICLRAQYPLLRILSWTDTASVTDAARSRKSPSVAQFNTDLYYAYQAEDSRRIYVAGAFDGSRFSRRAVGDRDTSPESPAIARFNDKLCVAWTADDPSHRLFVSCSTPPFAWPAGAPAQNEARSSHAPALATFSGILYMAW